MPGRSVAATGMPGAEVLEELQRAHRFGLLAAPVGDEAEVGRGDERDQLLARNRRTQVDVGRSAQSQKPKLDTVTFRFIGDTQAQAAALRAGDVDAFPEFVAAELFGAFQKDDRFTT